MVRQIVSNPKIVSIVEGESPETFNGKETTGPASGIEPPIVLVKVCDFVVIIAKTKKGTISTVIYGVAIATALMPPLCTVGYGLATGKLSFAVGAMYLFMINTLYIVLATYLIIKFWL